MEPYDNLSEDGVKIWKTVLKTIALSERGKVSPKELEIRIEDKKMLYFVLGEQERIGLVEKEEFRGGVIYKISKLGLDWARHFISKDFPYDI